MSIVLDVLVFVIIAVTAFIGYRRGFVRYIVRMLRTAACVVVALVVSDMAAGPVYSNIVAPRLESTLLGRFGNFSITDSVRGALRDMGVSVPLDDKQLKKALSDPGSIPAALERTVRSSGASDKQAEELKAKTESFFDEGFGGVLAKAAGVEDHESVGRRLEISAGKAYDLVRAFASEDGNEKGVHYLVYNIMDSLMTTVIRFIIFVVLFILLEIIVSVIFRLAGVLDHLPVISGANRGLGLAAGVVKGVLYVVLLAAIFSAVVKSDTVIDPQGFEDSKEFSIFFGFFYK